MLVGIWNSFVVKELGWVKLFVIEWGGCFWGMMFWGIGM